MALSKAKWAFSYFHQVHDNDGNPTDIWQCKEHPSTKYKVKDATCSAGPIGHIEAVHQKKYADYVAAYKPAMQQTTLQPSQGGPEAFLKIVSWAARHGIPEAAFRDSAWDDIQSGKCARLTHHNCRRCYLDVAELLVTQVKRRIMGQFA
jgi:hypothetical protein